MRVLSQPGASSDLGKCEAGQWRRLGFRESLASVSYSSAAPPPRQDSPPQFILERLPRRSSFLPPMTLGREGCCGPGAGETQAPEWAVPVNIHKCGTGYLQVLLNPPRTRSPAFNNQGTYRNPGGLEVPKPLGRCPHICWRWCFDIGAPSVRPSCKTLQCVVQNGKTPASL